MSQESNHETSRAGSTLFETIAAVAISGMMVAATLQSISAVWQQSRRTERRWVATCEAGNLMEDLATWRWETLSAESVKSIQLSDECRRSLPDARLTVDIVPSEDEQRLKYVRIEIDWLSASDVRSAPVQLVAARYRDDRASQDFSETSTEVR